METDWKSCKLKTGAELLRKEQFVYRIAGEEYDIELFESINGEYYAIGQPAHSDRLMIYGSSVVNSPVTALNQTIHKINRDAEHQEIWQIGEDVRNDGQEE